MKKLVLLTLLSACGPYNFRHDGEVLHKMTIDLSEVEKYFEYLCDGDEACVRAHVGSFLSLLSTSRSE